MFLIKGGSFNQLSAAYCLSGLPITCQTMIDILENAIDAAKTIDQLETLREKIVSLRQEGLSNPRAKYDAERLIALFEKQSVNLEKNPAIDLEKELSVEEIVSKQAEKIFSAEKITKHYKNQKYSVEKIDSPEEIVERSLYEKSSVFKNLYWQQIKNLDLRISEILSLYKKYIIPYETENNSYKGESHRLKYFFLKIMIEKAESQEDWLMLYNLTNKNSKERKAIVDGLLKTMPIPEDVLKAEKFLAEYHKSRGREKKRKIRETNLSFGSWIYLYLKSKDLFIFEKAAATAFGLDQQILTYTFMPVYSSYYEKKEQANKIFISIRTEDDRQKVKRIIPKWDILWSEPGISQKARIIVS